MKLKKRILSFVAAAAIATSICPATPASAKSLKDSFSGYTNVYYVGSSWTGGSYYRKSCTAKTDGYYKRHYVRAYIGGSYNSPSGASVDTGRCYSNGNISRTATTDNVFVPSYSFARFYFPTGYAKYGN